MVIVQLMFNGYPSMVKEVKTPRELIGVFKLAEIEGYTVNIHQGWDLCWVQNAWLNWQEELDTQAV